MHFLTWQGTLVSLDSKNGTLAHQCLPFQQKALEPLDIDLSDGPKETTIRHPTLGKIQFIPLNSANFFQLVLNGEKLYSLSIDDKNSSSPGAQERSDVFLAITFGQLQDIIFILEHRWIVCSDRRAALLQSVTLGVGFSLSLGRITIDLAGSLAKLARAKSGRRAPVSFSGSYLGEKLEILLAEPSDSSLLYQGESVTQYQRVVQIPAVVAYRQVFGLEPTKSSFERAASLLPTSGGGPRREDFLMGLKPELSESGANNWKSLERSHLATVGDERAACPVVSLGTGCIVACALRDMEIDRAPMPFDWLTTTPAMVRHCIETDFKLLLDQSYYKSLTGKQEFRQPENGCDHLFYKQQFGLQRVFNHSDPTRRLDYRYLTACVDRMRELIDSDGPKLFVQCTRLNVDSDRDFSATADLIDAVTKNASYLYLLIDGADRRLTVPQLSLVKRKGRHELLHIQPTSKMGGEYFEAEIDNTFFRWVISIHSAASTSYRSRLDASHAALEAAFQNFDQGLPIPAEAQLQSSSPAVIRWANSVVANFRKKSNLYLNVEIGAFASDGLNIENCHSVFLAETSGENVLILSPGNKPLSRVVINRLLTFIYLFDSMLSDGPIPPARFLVELGDHASSDSVSFCSNIEEGCLMPDSDFISSSGYSETRILVEKKSHTWSERIPMLFWRGATTGHRTKQPPGVDEADDFGWLPRLDMCRRLRDSHLAANCDVGITNIVQVDEPHLRHRILASQLCKPTEGREKLLRYRYTIVIDGNSNAWSSLFCALLSGACVLLVDSPGNFRQWYYRKLVPWKHYVPVASNLDDLEDRISWVLTRDTEAETIGREAQKLAHAMSFESEVESAAKRLREWLRTSSSRIFEYRRLDPARSALTSGWVLGHVQDRGDTAAIMGDWVGELGSGKFLEGIQIMLPATIAEDVLTYRVVFEGGKLSAPVSSGEYLGTRGATTPIYGVAITVGRNVRDFDVECEASFIDGTRLGPVASGVTCAATSGAAMEAFRISIHPSRDEVQGR